MSSGSDVSPALPPAAVLRVLNPMMRLLLRSPAGRAVPGLALLEFRGRRTGHHFRVPVGLHAVDGVAYVLTPSSWRANFSGGGPAVLRHRGRARSVVGTLIPDPETVAVLFRAILAEGTRPGLVGLRMEPSHELVAADVQALDRCAIRFADASRPA